MKRCVLALGFLVGFVLIWSACSQQTTTVAVRSLERSSRASFVCLRDNTSSAPGLELDSCFTPGTPFPINDYSLGPHAIALVTQTTRGEVAVIDVTAQTVLDADGTVPGYNFLPVGALPTDIVSTPGGNATFVASADPLRPGIFAIPSVRLPGQLHAQKPTLASWPACFLDAAPTNLAIVADRTGTRAGLCDPSQPPPTPTADFDISGETAVFGRLKIIATLSDPGQIAVIDAQELLARPPGSFDRCLVEQTLTLQAVLPGAGGSDGATDGAPADAGLSDATGVEGGVPADGAASVDGGEPVDLATCSGRVVASPQPSLQPHPVQMALADDQRLFVSDDSASVVHVLDVSDPCNVSEEAPLLPFSVAEPTRAVVTSSIAVSPLTTDKKRFVYAVDARSSRNVMVFDVSLDSTTRRPLILQPTLVYNQFEPIDRVQFSAPVEGLAFATREVPQLPAMNGVEARAIKCDPTASATDATNPYRPSDLTTGLPPTLRGTFAFAALSSGRVAVADLDDYDAPCRRPSASDDSALGCPGTLQPPITLPSASAEASCNVVERHRLRSLQYFANGTLAGQHAPAMQTPPLLHDKTGTVQSTDPAVAEAAGRPRLLGPALTGKTTETRTLLATVASGSGVADDPANRDLSSDPAESQRNWVAFDLREPRAHYDQTWFITYEGVLPPFAGRRGRFQCAADEIATECEGGSNPSNFVLYDSSVGFCDQGAQGAALAASMGLPSGDIVQVIENLPDPADPYWATVNGVCSPVSCEGAYGTPDNPGDGRDFAVDTAFEDRLVLEPDPPSTDPKSKRHGVPFACCFPYPVTYTVRAGKHWLVTGSAIGYQHHIIPDPTAANASTARCIASCDSRLALRNSRAIEVPRTSPPPPYDDQNPGVFKNAQIQFVLWEPKTCTTTTPCRTRDMYFSFVETGGFIPTEVGLSTVAVMPQSIRFVRGINELAIPDAVSQGLMLFDLGSLSQTGVRAFD